MEKENKIEENLLEFGAYKITGPDNGDLVVDKISLKNHTGKERIWKVKSMSEKEIILEVIKF